MTPLTRDEIESAQRIVYEAMPPTPQYTWPLLGQRLDAQVWVKHENHTPVGAFKVRGGLVYLQALRAREPGVAGVLSATRGNHGQSIALAARRHGLGATIVVPHGNLPDKNAAMRAFGESSAETRANSSTARKASSSATEATCGRRSQNSWSGADTAGGTERGGAEWQPAAKALAKAPANRRPTKAGDEKQKTD